MPQRVEQSRFVSRAQHLALRKPADDAEQASGVPVGDPATDRQCGDSATERGVAEPAVAKRSETVDHAIMSDMPK